MTNQNFFNSRLRSVAEILNLSPTDICDLANKTFPDLSPIEQLRAIFPILRDQADEQLRSGRNSYYENNPQCNKFLLDLQFEDYKGE